MALAVFLVETPSDYCLLLCYNPCFIFFLFCCGALFPAKSMVPPPVPCYSASAASSYCYVRGTACYSSFLFFFRSFSAPPWFVCLYPLCVGCVVLDPPTGYQLAIIYHRTDRTSKQQPCPPDSACALSACLLRFSSVFFLFFFLYFFLLFIFSVPSSCFSFSFSSSFFRVYIKYDGYVPGVTRLQVVRVGIPQLVTTVSLTD